MIKTHLDQWIGCALTILILIIAITPNTLNIPTGIRPWIFLGSVIWILVFSSGVFNS